MNFTNSIIFFHFWKLPIVRETGTGALVEGLSWREFQRLCRTNDIETEQRDEANLSFVFDTDVASLINILETLGKTK